MKQYLVVRTEIGLLAGEIVDSNDDAYVIKFGTEGTVNVEKQYVYEENGVLFVEQHDITE